MVFKDFGDPRSSFAHAMRERVDEPKLRVGFQETHAGGRRARERIEGDDENFASLECGEGGEKECHRYRKEPRPAAAANSAITRINGLTGT